MEDQEIEIDSRPSDAIAIALRLNAPIYAAPEVLAKASRIPGPGHPKKKGQVRKIMGFHLQNLTAELAGLFNLKRNGGVLVAEVETGSVASEAGIQRGDVITDLNDQKVRNVRQLEAFIRDVKRPSRVKIKIHRAGRPLTVTLDIS